MAGIPPTSGVFLELMRIDVWSDVVCPWCYLGEHRLRAALTLVPGSDAIEVRMRAFQLDPRARRVPEDLRAVLERKYGPGAYDAMTARLTALGTADGLDYHFERVQRVNTFDAHRVIAWAGAVDLPKQGALARCLFESYFTRGQDIGDPTVLAAAASDAGFDPEDARAALADGAFADEVMADRAEAVELGITGVPAFVVDGQWMIPGAQEVETFVRVLERALERLGG